MNEWGRSSRTRRDSIYVIGGSESWVRTRRSKGLCRLVTGVITRHMNKARSSSPGLQSHVELDPFYLYHNHTRMSYMRIISKDSSCFI